MDKLLSCALISMLVGLLAGQVVAVNIETVPVGNPGNAADMRYNLGQRPEGYGHVDYSYRIGKFEITAGQYCEFLNAVAKIDPYGLYSTGMSNTTYGSGISRSGSSSSYTYSVDAAFVNRPVNYVSWGDSARFANWLHNGQPTGAQNAGTTEDGAYFLNGATTDATLLGVTRKTNAKWAIPTEDEWYKASYHKNDGVTGNYFDYPTSRNTHPGRDLADLSGNNANFFDFTPYPIDSPYYTTVVGEFQNSPSPYGTFDQGGNVWEWNEAVVAVYGYPYAGLYRGLRGDSFGNLEIIIFGDYLRGSDRGYGKPADEYYGAGFRVVEVPEPGSVVLLALGGLAVMRRPGKAWPMHGQ